MMISQNHLMLQSCRKTIMIQGWRTFMKRRGMIMEDIMMVIMFMAMWRKRDTMIGVTMVMKSTEVLQSILLSYDVSHLSTAATTALVKILGGTACNGCLGLGLGRVISVVWMENSYTGTLPNSLTNRNSLPAINLIGFRLILLNHILIEDKLYKIFQYFV